MEGPYERDKQNSRNLERIANQLQWANWLKFIELAQKDVGMVNDDIWDRIEKGIGIAEMKHDS